MFYEAALGPGDGDPGSGDGDPVLPAPVDGDPLSPVPGVGEPSPPAPGIGGSVGGGDGAGVGTTGIGGCAGAWAGGPGWKRGLAVGRDRRRPGGGRGRRGWGVQREQRQLARPRRGGCARARHRLPGRPDRRTVRCHPARRASRGRPGRMRATPKGQHGTGRCADGQRGGAGGRQITGLPAPARPRSPAGVAGYLRWPVLLLGRDRLSQRGSGHHAPPFGHWSAARVAPSPPPQPALQSDILAAKPASGHVMGSRPRECPGPATKLGSTG
jgi:hypothetical protein